LSVAIALALFASSQPATLVLELPVSPETPEGQRLVAAGALSHCRGKFPVIGRYRFEGTEAVGTNAPRFRFEAEISCTDTAPPPPSAVAAPRADWQPSAEDSRRVEAATRAYFAAVDAGDVARLESMMSTGHRDTSTAADRRAANAEFRQMGGRPKEHRILRTTWYVNPPGVEPGAYVAVDFDRQYENLAVSCGYVAWHRQPDGSFLLVREESGHAPRTASTSPDEIVRLRAMLRCRD
jgi:hypothetical protein